MIISRGSTRASTAKFLALTPVRCRARKISRRFEALQQEALGRYEAMRLSLVGDDQIASLTVSVVTAAPASAASYKGQPQEIQTATKPKVEAVRARTNARPLVMVQARDQSERSVSDMGTAVRSDRRAGPGTTFSGPSKRAIDVVGDRGAKSRTSRRCEKAGCIPHVPRCNRGLRCKARASSARTSSDTTHWAASDTYATGSGKY